MTVADDIAKIKVQEERLQFSKFDEADAWALGQLMRQMAHDKKLPLVIEIKIGVRPLFFTALSGTAADNADWARRKFNTVMRFGASSYRVGLEIQKSGKEFGASRGVNVLDFAPAGGGFPIAIKNVGVVGAVTVSGIPQREDHGFVVEALCAFLKQPHAELALPAES